MIYNIVSIHELEVTNLYVSSNYNCFVMQYLIAYIQFKFWEIAPDYGLSVQQIRDILIDIYDFAEAEPTDDCIIIDIFEEWERHCSAFDIIISIKIFHNDKLHNELVKQFNLILKSIYG